MECKLKEILSHRGMSQTFLAGKLGVAKQTVYTWTVQKAYPPIPLALKLAEFLNVDITDIWIYNKKEEK